MSKNSDFYEINKLKKNACPHKNKLDANPNIYHSYHESNNFEYPSYHESKTFEDSYHNFSVNPIVDDETLFAESNSIHLNPESETFDSDIQSDPDNDNLFAESNTTQSNIEFETDVRSNMDLSNHLYNNSYDNHFLHNIHCDDYTYTNQEANNTILENENEILINLGIKHTNRFISLDDNTFLEKNILHEFECFNIEENDNLPNLNEIDSISLNQYNLSDDSQNEKMVPKTDKFLKGLRKITTSEKISLLKKNILEKGNFDSRNTITEFEASIDDWSNEQLQSEDGSHSERSSSTIQECYPTGAFLKLGSLSLFGYLIISGSKLFLNLLEILFMKIFEYIGLPLNIFFFFIEKILYFIFFYTSFLLINRKKRKRFKNWFLRNGYKYLNHTIRTWKIFFGIPILFYKKDRLNPRLLNLKLKINNVNRTGSDGDHCLPIFELGKLPHLRNILTNDYYLLDSGCFFNLANINIVKELEERFGLNLKRFKHSIKLSSHSDTPLNIDPLGVYLPLVFQDINNRDVRITLPFLIERSPNSKNIIGFESIKSLNLNFGNEFLTCTFNEVYIPQHDESEVFSVLYSDNKLKPASNSTNHILLQSVDEQTFHEDFCKTYHGPEIKCSKAIEIRNDKSLRSSLTRILGFDPVFVNKVITHDSIHRINDYVEFDTGTLLENTIIGYGQNIDLDNCYNRPDIIGRTVRLKNIKNKSKWNGKNSSNFLDMIFVDNNHSCLLCSGNCSCKIISRRYMKKFKSFPRPVMKIHKRNTCIVELDNISSIYTSDICMEIVQFLNKSGIDKIYLGSSNFSDTGYKIFDHFLNCIQSSFNMKLPPLLLYINKEIIHQYEYIDNCDSNNKQNASHNDVNISAHSHKSVRSNVCSKLIIERTDLNMPHIQNKGIHYSLPPDGSEVQESKSIDLTHGLETNTVQPVPETVINDSLQEKECLLKNLRDDNYMSVPETVINDSLQEKECLLENLKDNHTPVPETVINNSLNQKECLLENLRRYDYESVPETDLKNSLCTKENSHESIEENFITWPHYLGDVPNTNHYIEKSQQNDLHNKRLCADMINHLTGEVNVFSNTITCEVNNINNLSVCDPYENNSLKEGVEGIPNRFLAPPSIQFFPEVNAFSKDFDEMLKHSNPNLQPFLELLFKAYPNTYSKTKYDLGGLKNPNFQMDLILKSNNLDELPRHAPYPSNPFKKKAADRIVRTWEKSHLIIKSNEKSFASRLLVVTKHLNSNDYNSIRSRLRNEHDIVLDEFNQADLYKVDPDLLTDNEISKSYRVVVDSRCLNSISEAVVPIQQNVQHSLFDLIFNLGKDDKNCTLPPKLKVKNRKELRKCYKKQDVGKEYVAWEPELLKSFEIDKLNEFLKNSHFTESENDQLFISSLDMKSAHNMVRLTKNASNLLNIITPNCDFFKFIFAPFGLKNISSYFNYAIIEIFKDLIQKCFIFLYADDLLIVSRGSLHDHALLITECIQRLEENGIKLSLSKCFFAASSFKYLGFNFNSKGIRLTDERINAIKNFESPHNLQGVQRLCGFLQYLSLFYPNLATDCAPISDLLRKKDDFKWTETQEKAFQKIKQTICSGLSLSYYQRGSPLYMYCDSSGVAGGAAVFYGNLEDKNSLKPLMFISKKYTPHMINLYSSVELEASNIIFSLEKIKYLIDIVNLTVYTDAKALLYIIKGSRISNSPRLARLATKLSQFPVSYRLEYIKPSVHGLMLADTISRQTLDDSNKINCPPKLLRNIDKADVTHDITGTVTFKQLVNYVKNNPSCVPTPPGYKDCKDNYPFDVNSNTSDIDFVFNINQSSVVNDILPHISDKLSAENIIVEQRKDEHFSNIISILTKDNINSFENITTENYFMKKGLLFKYSGDISNNSIRNSRLVIPDSLIYTLIASMHVRLGHIGINKLSDIMSLSYHNKNMNSKINDMISKCHLCLVSKPLNTPKNKIYPIYNVMHPMSLISIDHFKMTSSMGKSHCLIIIDEFSGFCWLQPVKNEKASYVAKYLDQFFFSFGAAVSIKSDNSRSLLKSKEVIKILNKHGVRRSILTVPYQPTHNSRCERKIRSVREILRIFSHNKKVLWPNIIDQISFILNSCPKKFIGNGESLVLSPFEIFFNRKPVDRFVNPSNILQSNSPMKSKTEYDKINEIINQHIAKTKRRYQSQYNLNRSDGKINVGDMVLYKDLAPPAAGVANKKSKIPFLNRLFICRYISGQKAIIEDLITAVTLVVSPLHLKVYKSRPEYFAELPQNVKDEMGDYLNLSFSSRAHILDSLKSLGFETSKTFGSEDLVNEKPITRNKISKVILSDNVSLSNLSSNSMSTVSQHVGSDIPGLQQSILNKSANKTNNSDILVPPPVSSGDMVKNVQKESSSSIKSKLNNWGSRLRKRLKNS